MNAAATRVYERACYWVEWGHEVTVLTCVPNFPEGKVFAGYKNKWYQEQRIDGIRVIRLKTYMAPNKGTFKRSIDFISYMIMSVVVGIGVKKPDIIAATTPQFFAGLAGGLLSLFRRQPFVLEVSDLWPASIAAVGALKSRRLYNLLERLEKLLYKKADTIVAVTDSFRQNMIARSVPDNKISVIRNGVDLGRYYPQPYDEQLAERLGLKDHFVIGYIGTLGMAHGLDNVLRTASLLRERPQYKFLFVGSGAERDQLREKADQWRLDNVVFVERQPKNDILRYWQLGDIALIHLRNNPVFKEVIPSKLFESMAMAKPVITVLPEGEATDIVNKEQIGIAVEPENPEKLKEGIEYLYDSPQLVESLTENCRVAAPNYSRSQQARDMLAEFNKLVKGQ